jgi:hypothetical protein
MSFPVIEKITEAIKNRLFDFDNQVQVIRTEMLSDFSPANKQVVIVQQDPTTNEDYSCHGNPPAQAFTIPYQIVCIARQTETSSEALDSVLSDFAAGAIKTMTTPTAWYQWGGEAIDSKITGMEKNVLDGYATQNILLEVIFRTDENNPYNRR